MKNKIILFLTLFTVAQSQSVFSSPTNPCKPLYVGIQVGHANLHYEGSDLSDGTISVDDEGFATRFLAGFDLNQNIGLEMGYNMYPKPEFKYPGHVKTNFSQDSLDFLAKVSLPISCNVSLYVKGGMAYVHRDNAEVITNNVILKVSEEDNHLRPVLGGGMSYAMNSYVSADIGYFRTFGVDDLEDIDFYGAGLTFRIG